MGTKSPHPNTPIRTLLRIRENNYLSYNSQKEYQAEEVEQLIIEKHNKKLEEKIRRQEKAEEQRLKELGLKYCPPCKTHHRLSAFGFRGKENKLLRSMCRVARANKTAEYREQIKTPF